MLFIIVVVVFYSVNVSSFLLILECAKTLFTLCFMIMALVGLQWLWFKVHSST